jgi:hypothetical protein
MKKIDYKQRLKECKVGFLVICSNCSKKYNVKSRTQQLNKNHFCCKLCRSVWQSINFKGKNNSNFGHRWSKELREKRAIMTKQQFIDNPQLRIDVGNAHRGIKRTKESIEKQIKTAKINNTNNPGRYNHSEEDKIIIGIKSAEKFKNPEYRDKLPSIIEKTLRTRTKNGNCVPYEQMNEFKIYRKEANWVDNMIKYFNEQQKIQFKKIGFFKPKINNIGLVRDHKLTRKTGFILKIFPEILRHPTNCQLILNTENSSKGGRKDDITADKLFEDIINFSKEWKEQEKCIFLIKEYKTGKRWEKPNLLSHLKVTQKGGGLK